MIRKSKVTNTLQERPSKFKGMLRYKKIRGGVHRHMYGQVVRKGEILYAYEGELSPLVMKGFECLDEQIKEATVGISLGLKDRGNGWYDVINKITGEVLNDTAMRAKDAKQFITGDIKDAVAENDEVEDEVEEVIDSETIVED